MRTIVAVATSALLLAACGGQTDTTTSTTTTGAGGTTHSGGSGGVGGVGGNNGGGGGAPFSHQAELAWDDGHSEAPNSPWTTTAGAQIAVCFVAPAHPTRVDTARFYVAGPFGIPTTPFRARVYAATGGVPAADLLPAGVTGAASGGNQWVDVDLTANPIVVDSGDFCLAMEWTTAAGNDGSLAQFLGNDTTDPDSHTFWGPSTWQPVAGIGGSGDRDAMIRAVVAY